MPPTGPGGMPGLGAMPMLRPPTGMPPLPQGMMPPVMAGGLPFHPPAAPPGTQPSKPEK